MKNTTPDSLEMRLGRRIKCRRQELDIDIAKLSNQSEISLNRIVKFEDGIGTLEIFEIQRLSAALSMPISVLFEDGSNEQKTYNFISPKDGLALNYAFLRVKDESVRSEIIALVQALSNGGSQPCLFNADEISIKLTEFRQSLLK